MPKIQALRKYLPLAISLPLYVVLACWLPRSAFYGIVPIYGLLFLCYGWYYFSIPRNAHRDGAQLSIGDGRRQRALIMGGLGFGLLMRLGLVFVFPFWSDDIYRFIWDGRLLLAGMDPFAYLPVHFFDGTYTGQLPKGIDQALLDQLNSPNYFTIYPAVCQFVFWLGNVCFPQDIVGAARVMKGCIFLFECGSLFLLWRLCERFHISSKTVLLYALNPLVILELCGNLHFEAAMIFFTLLAIYCFGKATRFADPKKIEAFFPDPPIHWGWLTASAVALGMAVNSKLLPLIILPFLLRQIGLARTFFFGSVVGIVGVLGFASILEWRTALHLMDSVDLYFSNFEFNASVYYLIRGIGYGITGYNIIAFAGSALAVLTLIAIFTLALKDKVFSMSAESWTHFAQWAWLIFLLLATTVHPWYACVLVAFAVLTGYRFAIVWSALLILSYHVYQDSSYTENLWWVALSYALFFVVLFFEWSVKTWNRW